MEKVRIKIKGISPLLSNKYTVQETSGKVGRKDEQRTSEGEANKSLYFDETIGCYAPSSWIEASLREAAKGFKQGRLNFKNTILASVFVDQEKIPLNKRTYDEIDVRGVVIQRNRIAKSRPKFNTWELEFDLSFDQDRISKETLQQILKEAGASKGIGDYRPKFGRFEVVSFV